MVPSYEHCGRILALLCVAALIAPGALADKAEKSKTEESESPKVYTTEDLERLYADQPGDPKTKSAVTVRAAPAEGNDPLKVLQQQQAAQAEQKRLIAEADKKIAEAEKRVQELEQRIRATKNPLLARPPIPEKERAEWASQDAAQRVRSSEQKLQQAREELEQAKAEAKRLRAS